MKKTVILIALLLAFVACTTTKSIEKQSNNGYYDAAISASLKKLSGNKTKKSKQETILLLKNAFDKATERDLNTIDYLVKDNNTANFESIYDQYKILQQRQESIKPILPLYYEGKAVAFDFKNYNPQIIEYKEKTSNHLYNKAINLLYSANKTDVRKAYNAFKYIDKLNPNYKDVKSRTEEALIKGQDLVLLSIKNQTQQVLPKKLESDLLNISTYGLNDLWTVYHNKRTPLSNYNYDLSVVINAIKVSPEQVKERQIRQEKTIKDGFKYTLDKKGNVKKDSLGNDIKVQKYKKVTCQYFETRQFKTATIKASVNYTNLKTRQLLDRFPIESTYLFEHFYATYKGDKRAIKNELLKNIENKVVPFPNTQQMIFDTGEDLKIKLKKIISGYKIR